MIHVLGIRHHGPGSAKSLRRALRELAPDILLIEGPPDADHLIEQVANEGLKPPVALLVYNPKDLGQAAYFPFADFSPEWQAMRYGLRQNIPVRFMDLPQSIHFGIQQKEAQNTQLALPETTQQSFQTEEEFLIQKDPMTFAARQSGYTDSERWWEVMFEQEEGSTAIFSAILELIEAMRMNAAVPPPRELQREAFMRESIRKAVKEGYENIAVVCGAWHAPVLQELDRFTSKADKALLRGIKKIKTSATWVPWTYDRLSTSSGYRAGIISPAYYRLLFSNRKEVTIRWMSKVARLFRKEDLDASSAHVIEAVRLAETLAAMRSRTVPGLDEMYEAAVSIFCEGYESRMELIEQKLIIGDQMGKVPPEIPVIPLQQDLERAIKSARLTKERNSTEATDKKLDLRTPSNLLASHLLHRLQLLQIPWGKPKKGSRFQTGNFTEIWKLQWKPDFAIRIIEAGMWGNTVYAASNQYVHSKVKEVDSLPELTSLVEAALNADLKEAVEALVKQLEKLSALTKDIHNLMDALPALVNAIRYGSTRKLNLGALEQVVDKIIPRICISLPSTCISIDEEASKEVFEKLLAVNQAINILTPTYNQIWYHALEKVATHPQINGILQGGCTRILFDKELLDTEQAATQMRFALSRGNDSMHAALWLEGFLYGSGLLLIHNPVLWNILDEWIEELPSLAFQEVLPLLRRTFSEFSTPERQKMMDLAKQGQLDTQGTDSTKSWDMERAQQILPTVQLLLGID